MERSNSPRVDVADFSGAIYAGGGDESLSMRILQRQIAGVSLYPAHDSALHAEDFRAADGSDRYSYRCPGGELQGDALGKRTGGFGRDSQASSAGPGDPVAKVRGIHATPDLLECADDLTT